MTARKLLAAAGRYPGRWVGPDARRLLGARLLRGLAPACARPAGTRPVHRVVHVSPAYFDPSSYIGGGERYPTSLAAAMAELVETCLVSFGPRRESLKAGRLRIEVFPAPEFIDGAKHDPNAWVPWTAVRQADAVHCHQYAPFVSTLTVLAAALWHRPVFVTDLGGGGWNVGQRVPTHPLVTRFCAISEFAIQDFERGRASVIHGGVSPSFLAEQPLPWPRKRQVLFVGRLLPHKGINYLIEAMPPELDLLIIGPRYHEDYYQLLQRLAVGKRVHFITDARDEDIVAAYRESTVTVLPSVHTDVYGSFQPRAELLGLTLLESQASGTPAICTAVGGMPEFVQDGMTGFIVPPNDPPALRNRINQLVNDSVLARELGAAGRQMVEDRFTWRRVAERCLKIYTGEYLQR